LAVLFLACVFVYSLIKDRYGPDWLSTAVIILPALLFVKLLEPIQQRRRQARRTRRAQRKAMAAWKDRGPLNL